MQSHQDRPEYPTVNDPEFASTAQYGHQASTVISILEPYTPPNVPHGLPHVVRFATLSSMDLPLDVRFLIILIARFADVHGVASVANSTLCEITRIGSHHTVERWISLASDLGILRKEPGKGGKDRKSNKYVFLGEARGWQPLPVGHPDTNPVVALAHARLVIEQLLVKAARVDELEAENARLRNGGSSGHPQETNGEGENPVSWPAVSQAAGDPGVGAEPHGAVGHSEVTNGSPEDPSRETPHNYESPDSDSLPGTHETIGHSEVTNGSPDNPPAEASHSYENPDSGTSQESHGAIGHSRVTNGSPDNPPEEASHSYENPDSGTSQESHRAIGHSGVPNGPVAEPDEGQEYLARRARVEEIVMAHGAYYRRSFSRRGLPGAVEYFSRSDEHEQELLRQVRILEAGEDPRQAGTGPPGQDEEPPDPDRYAFGYCPDCGKPFATYGGAEYCTDCTQRRRRESEA